MLVSKMENDTVSIIAMLDETSASFEYNLNNLSESEITNNDTYLTSVTSSDPWIVTAQSFMIAEVAMTVFEFVLVITVAIKYKRFRRNYRNQMLMQLSLVRLLKRVMMYIKFRMDDGYDDGASAYTAEYWTALLSFLQIYMDVTMVLLIAFFIKYMYDSLIIVIVKFTPKNFTRTVLCAWLPPLPVAALLTAVEFYLLNHWQLYLIICCVFRWPLIVVGTHTYMTVLFRVMMDSGRRSLRGLTATTFLLCITINLYLFCRDLIELWCYKLTYVMLMGILGMVYNVLVLVIYVYLIAESTRRASKKRCAYCCSVDYPTQYRMHSEFSGSFDRR